jgi:hypothetical protein
MRTKLRVCPVDVGMNVAPALRNRLLLTTIFIHTCLFCSTEPNIILPLLLIEFGLFVAAHHWLYSWYATTYLPTTPVPQFDHTTLPSEDRLKTLRIITGNHRYLRHFNPGAWNGHWCGELWSLHLPTCPANLPIPALRETVLGLARFMGNSD